MLTTKLFHCALQFVHWQRKICIHRFMSWKMFLPYFWSTREKTNCFRFLKNKFQGNLAYLADTIKTLNTMNPKLRGPRATLFFYYFVLGELRARIQLWVEWTGTKNISSIFDLAMHSKKRFMEMISRKYPKSHLVCFTG